jgi:hypothetical protein
MTRKLQFHHDSCQFQVYNETSFQFEYAGQNIAVFFKIGRPETREYYIEQAVKNWFNEYQGTPLEV